ncbi:MAG: sensor histidine kinase, partial [Stenotrophomonas indicatrix]
MEILWQPGTLVWVVLGGEGFAALFALAADPAQGRWIQFGLASFMIQWVLLLTLGGLYLLR